MLSLLVFDDWLTTRELEAVHEAVRAHYALKEDASDPVFSWYSPKQYRHVSDLDTTNKETAEFYIQTLAARLHPLITAEAGYEWWSNVGNSLDMHVDKDETHYDETGEFLYPSWSTVLYTDVDLKSGGELILEDHALVVPKTNRLVVFGPGINHGINDFQGRRSSLAVNFWDVTPKGIA